MKLSLGAVLAVVTLAGCGGGATPAQDPAATAAARGPTVLKSETREYVAGGTTLEGYLAYGTSPEPKRPGIVLFHDWMGLGKNPKQRADELARLGYVVLAADLYGKGIRPTSTEEAGKLATQYKTDRATLRLRARAALDALVATGKVDPEKVVATGYCFGGTAALELARTGAPLAGTVTFHGGLDTPDPTAARNIEGRVLVLHGADDPFVKPAEVAAFEDEMRTAHVDWQLVAYGGAVHAFTIEDAGSDNAKGAAYNKSADLRSWQAMRSFLDELWAKPGSR